MARSYRYRVRVLIEPRLPDELLDADDVASGVPRSSFELDVSAETSEEARRLGRRHALSRYPIASIEDYRAVATARRLVEPQRRPRRLAPGRLGGWLGVLVGAGPRRSATGR